MKKLIGQLVTAIIIVLFFICAGFADEPRAHFRAEVRSFEVSCFPEPEGDLQVLVVDLDEMKIYWKKQTITEEITKKEDLPGPVQKRN